MIHDLSVLTREPEGVVDFFARLMKGVVIDFTPNSRAPSLEPA